MSPVLIIYLQELMESAPAAEDSCSKEVRMGWFPLLG